MTESSISLEYPYCPDCYEKHNPENECGWYDDFCDEMYDRDSQTGNYYIVKKADGSEIYLWRDEFACSHCSKPTDEIGDACEKCVKYFWSQIDPINTTLWMMYLTIKRSKTNV